jgi:hypothetical protein
MADPLAASETLLMYFMAWLYEQPKIKAFSTLQRYLYAVRATYLDNALPDPIANSPRLHRHLRGFKRMMKKPRSRPRHPITAPLLRAMLSSPEFDFEGSADDRVFRAMCVLALFGLLRCAEFTVHKASIPDNLDEGTWRSTKEFPKVSHLFPHQSIVNLMSFYIPASKTDPFGFGATINYANSSDRVLDPAKILAEYFIERSAAAASDDPLFPMPNGDPYTRARFLTRVRDSLKAINLQPKGYSGHSFRKGGCQSLRDAGVSDSDIRAMGRWSSWCFVLYSKLSSHRLSSLTEAMCRIRHPVPVN